MEQKTDLMDNNRGRRTSCDFSFAVPQLEDSVDSRGPQTISKLRRVRRASIIDDPIEGVEERRSKGRSIPRSPSKQINGPNQGVATR